MFFMTTLIHFSINIILILPALAYLPLGKHSAYFKFPIYILLINQRAPGTIKYLVLLKTSSTYFP